MEEVLLQYGVAGVAIIGLTVAVKVLYSDNKCLRDKMLETVIEQTKSDGQKFQTLQEALVVIRELKKGLIK
jgi:hypothetical protein